MNANTLTIQSYRNSAPVLKNKLHAVNKRKPISSSAAVIHITESVETLTTPPKPVGLNGWVMPPIIQPYFKGRDNDPL